MKNMFKWQAVGAGILCCGLSAFGASQMIEQSGWRAADAEVRSVEVSCHMKATERHVGYKTISEADIPCEAVDAFKMLHADKTWSSIENIDATLDVTGADGSTAQATLKLDRVGGVVPAPGDKLTVLQNPANPSEVAKTGQAGTQMTIVLGFGLIGAGILWFAFRKPGVAKAKPADAALSGMTEQEREAMADKMIAAAMAERDKALAGKSHGKSPARAAAPANPAMARSSAAPMIQPGRSSFGRKR